MKTEFKKLGQEMTLFEDNMIRLYGIQGEKWLSDLPSLVSDLSIKWRLTDLQPLENLSYNYALSGFQGSQAIVLKLGMDANALNREAVALKAFAPFGAVKILEHHDHALLLERVSPGNSLKSYFPAQEAEGILIACDVMTKLHQAPFPSGTLFPCVSDWLDVLNNEWDIPLSTLEKARQLKDHLLKTAQPSVLLHGDLHHDNILQNKTGWTVIDPKGVRGEPAYGANRKSW